MTLTLDYTAVRVGSDFPEQYADIGHGEGETVDFWLFKDGKLEIKKDKLANASHRRLWLGSTEYYYRGRYVPSKNWLTLTPPYRFEHRGVPSALLAQLEKAFPSAELKAFYV